MHRRAFLASAGGALTALTGCLGSEGGDGSSPTPRPTVTSDEPAAGVTVDSLQLQYGVVTPTTPDSIGVSDPNVPYLVASVRVDGPLPREAFGLRMGDVRYEPTRIDRLYRTAWGDDHRYERGRPDGLVLFDAPTGATNDLRLTWPGGERPVDEGIVARLGGSAPQLSASLDVPAHHEGTTAPPVAVEVTNGGSTASRFLGALNRGGPSVASIPVARLSELVPAGERTAISVADSWSGSPGDDRLGDGEPDVTYSLDFGDGEASAEVRLDGA